MCLAEPVGWGTCLIFATGVDEAGMAGEEVWRD